MFSVNYAGFMIKKCLLLLPDFILNRSVEAIGCDSEKNFF